MDFLNRIADEDGNEEQDKLPDFKNVKNSSTQVVARNNGSFMQRVSVLAQSPYESERVSLMRKSQKGRPSKLGQVNKSNEPKKLKKHSRLRILIFGWYLVDMDKREKTYESEISQNFRLLPTKNIQN